MNIQLEHKNAARKTRKYPITFLLDNVSCAQNVGGMFRMADALGVEQLVLTGSTLTPAHKKVRRVARATDSAVESLYFQDAVEAINLLKNKGYTIICLEMTSVSKKVEELCLQNTQRLCVVVGSEKNGISQCLLDLADDTAHIEMCGQNSSMNVAVAAALAMYTFKNQFCATSPM